MESDVRSVAAQFIPSKASTCPFAKCDSLTLLQHTVTTLRDSFSNLPNIEHIVSTLVLSLSYISSLVSLILTSISVSCPLSFSIYLSSLKTLEGRAKKTRNLPLFPKS
ncbi:unnamed protein product [Brassica rapa]|uniref:Uncharacterized protein n=1 Tax=Brassica campestris TaxID=3711 RepID=A0A8D9H6F9_BRACM|nr:unnamed protein product [Brassica rapa]